MADPTEAQRLTHERMRGDATGQQLANHAKPNNSDYWVLLALRLVFAAAIGSFAYSAIYAGIGVAIALGGPRPLPLDELAIFAVAFVVMAPLGAFATAGYVGLLCLVLVPIASLLCRPLLRRYGQSVAGRIVGGGVAAVGLAPFLASFASEAPLTDPSWPLVVVLILALLPLFLLQVAGAASGPADAVRRSRGRRLTFSIRSLLVATAAVAIAASRIASVSNWIDALVFWLAASTAVQIILAPFADATASAVYRRRTRRRRKQREKRLSARST